MQKLACCFCFFRQATVWIAEADKRMDDAKLTCCFFALLGKLLYGPLKVMREYKVAPCPHQRHGVDPVDCLGKTAKRSHPDYANQQTEDDKKKKGEKLQFFIATQVQVKPGFN